MTLPPLPFLAKTKVSWTGEEKEDLGFLENEIVRVFNFVDELWWQGSLSRNGAEGIFPKDFVTVLPPSQSGSAQATPTKSALASVLAALQRWLGKGERERGEGRLDQSEGRLKGPDIRDPRVDARVDSRGDVRGDWGDGRRSHPAIPVSPTADVPAEDPLDRPHKPRTKSVPALAAATPPAPLYSHHVFGLSLTQASADEVGAQTKRLSKLMTPDGSPTRASPRPHDDYLHTITRKKQELEHQLHRLRQLEKSQMGLRQVPLCDSSGSDDASRHLETREESGRSTELSVYTVSDEEGPPPPPKHRAPFDAEDFRASGATVEALESSCVRTEELRSLVKSLQSDVLNLLELSATSAGSFTRHKLERELQTPRDGGAAPKDVCGGDENVANAVFKNKKTHPPNLLMKLIKKRPEKNAMEARFERACDTWQQVKADLHRVNSLTSADKQTRTRRVVRSEHNFIVKPLEYVSDINTSETLGEVRPGDVALETNRRKLAEFVARYDAGTDLNDFVSDISVRFQAPEEQVRAVLLHLCKFRVEEEGETILRQKPKLREVMAARGATVYQLNYLFKKLLEALNIPAEVVLGFWKKPNEFYHSDHMPVNHCWLLVMLEAPLRGGAHAGGIFRMVDLVCFQKGLLCNVPSPNDFYFLTEPLHLVSTHIPSVVELQHVCPPVDLNVAFHLPRMYLGFQKHALRFVNFNNALTRLHDMEVFEADLEVPPNVEIFTLIKAASTTSNDYTLCQTFWSGTQRCARVKAILPAKEPIGVLQIFAGPRGTQTHFENVHELACVVPLYHTGAARECTFVPRYPTMQSQNYDLYIRHPQTNTVAKKHAYSFKIDAYPAAGPHLVPPMSANFKLVVESPSGKHTKLVADRPGGNEAGSNCATYCATILCQELGTYRGLVIGDTGNSWYVFTKWECAA